MAKLPKRQKRVDRSLLKNQNACLSWWGDAAGALVMCWPAGIVLHSWAPSWGAGGPDWSLTPLDPFFCHQLMFFALLRWTKKHWVAPLSVTISIHHSPYFEGPEPLRVWLSSSQQISALDVLDDRWAPKARNTLDTVTLSMAAPLPWRGEPGV